MRGLMKMTEQLSKTMPDSKEQDMSNFYSVIKNAKDNSLVDDKLVWG